MLRNFLVCAILSASICCTTLADGKSTYDFLRNDMGARSGALGGGQVLFIDDPTTIFSNPAGLATLTRTKFSVGFLKHLMDVNAGYAGFGTEIEGLGYVGAGIVYTNYGEFKRTTENADVIGTFGAGEFAATVGYGNELRSDLRFGVNAKLIYSSLADVSSAGAAVDLGVQYVVTPDRLSVGASLLNLGTQLNPYVTTRESLPLDFKVGAALSPEHLPATVLLNFHKLNEQQDNIIERLRAFSLGIEFQPDPSVNVRVGYNNERRRELKLGSSTGLAGFSAGIGFMTGNYALDYAYSSYGQIGGLHRISITF
jgi:hypothetical protein